MVENGSNSLVCSSQVVVFVVEKRCNKSGFENLRKDAREELMRAVRGRRRVLRHLQEEKAEIIWSKSRYASNFL